MITTYQRHLYLLAVAIIFLSLLSVINCTSDQLQEPSFEKQIRTAAPRKNHLYDILKTEKSNSNSREDEEIKNLIRDFFKNYPHRRASSFHAMRGKRYIKTA